MFGRGKTTFVSLILVRHFGLKFFTQQTLMDDQLLQALGGVGVRGQRGDGGGQTLPGKAFSLFFLAE